MNKNMGELIKITIPEIDKHISNDGKISRQFNGYISSFGASIVHNGLIPAVALFENPNSKTEKDRAKLMYVILEILKLKCDSKNSEQILLRYIINNKEEYKQKGLDIRKEIEDISIAIKLAIRTYELVED